MDTVLGVSMAPAAIQMVLLEGENADGPTIEEDEFDVIDAAGAAAAAGAPDQVIAAILGTREGAADAGLEVAAIGVSCTDQHEAAVLRDALAAHRIDNVMLVSAFLAATALAQSVGGAMGYERTAVLFVEPDTATLALVETSDGSITDVCKEHICARPDGEAAAQLSEMLAGLDDGESAPGGLFVVGSGVDLAALKPALEAATTLDVSVPEEPQTALARGAALASANAPLFASSTAALAYAQDSGAEAANRFTLPEYLSLSGVPTGAEAGEDDVAYSAVPDEDAEAPTALIEKLFLPEESQPRRRPVLLVGSGLAVAGISAVIALEIALAIGIRSTVALQPTPNQQLIVPTQAPPAPVEASAPRPKITLPNGVAAPKPQAPAVAAQLPAAPAPEAPAVAAAPVVPVVIPPVDPVVVPRVHIPAPLIGVPAPDRIISPPVVQAPPHPSPPEVFPHPVHVPKPQSPPGGGGTGPLSPPHHTPPGQGPGGIGGGHVPVPGTGPGGPGGGPGPIHVPGGPGDLGGGHVPVPGTGPGGPGGGPGPIHVPGGPGDLGGGHVPVPGTGPAGGGAGGGPIGIPGGGIGGIGGGAPSGPRPSGGGPIGGHGGGPFGGHGPAGGGGPFGGGGGLFGGGGPFGGGGFGHGGGGFGGGGGLFGGGGGPFGGGGFGHGGGGFGGGGFGHGGGGGFGGGFGGGHH